MVMTPFKSVVLVYLLSISTHSLSGSELKEVTIQSQSMEKYYFKNVDGEAFIAEQTNPEVFNMYFIEDVSLGGTQIFVQIYTADNLYLTTNDGDLTFEAYTGERKVIPNKITFIMWYNNVGYVDIRSSLDTTLLMRHFNSKLVFEVNNHNNHFFVVKPLDTHSMKPRQSGELKIGSTFFVDVAYNIESENNENTIYALVNKSNNYEEKGQLFVSGFKWELGKSVKKDVTTKLKYRIKDTSSNRESYWIKYRVADNDIQPEDNVILTMMNSNDDNLVISANLFTLTKDVNSNCRMENVTFDQYIKDNQLMISFSTFLYESGCGEDLRNVVFNLYNQEDELIPQRIDIDNNHISPTKSKIENNFVEVIFGRVFIGSPIKITIVYNVSENADYDTFKPIAILHEIIYNSYVENTIKEVIQKKTIETFISNTGKGGYRILRTNSSLCLKLGDDSETMYMKNHCTSKYRLYPHNILTEERKMLDGCTNNIYMTTVDYAKTTHLEWEQNNIKSFYKNEYLNSSAFVESTEIYTNISKTNAFYREPTSTFGLITKKTKSNATVQTATLSVVGLGSKINFCHQEPTKAVSECYKRLTTSDVKSFSARFHELRACNSSSCYGIDLYGNHLLYINKKHLLIKETVYNDLVGNGLYTESFVTSKNSLYLSEAAINTELTAGYHGLSSNNIKLVLWKKENDCANKVGKSENHLLGSCKETKAVCKSATSGMFWIIAKNIKYHVYCDMETDKGGWLKITDVDDNDGVLSGSVTHEIKAYLENPKLNYPTHLGMVRLASAMSFKQIRLYCRTSIDGVVYRTSHLRTTDTELGYKVVSYVTSSTDRPDACSSFRTYSDDTSLLVKKCLEWKGIKWAAGNNVASLVHIDTGPIWSIPIRVCDSTASYKDYNYVEWKIFIR